MAASDSIGAMTKRLGQPVAIYPALVAQTSAAEPEKGSRPLECRPLAGYNRRRRWKMNNDVATIAVAIPDEGCLLPAIGWKLIRGVPGCRRIGIVWNGRSSIQGEYAMFWYPRQTVSRYSQPWLAMLFLGLGLTLAITPSQARGPNIVLLLADDLGFADLACYGHPFHETPQLDRLAQRGMRFTQFYAGPVCSPTRCNLQAGLDQARFGITQHIPGHRRPFARLIDPTVPLQLPLETVTFAERLREAGYRTGYFGKWHLGGPGFAPQDQGWETAEETKGNTMPADPVRNPEGRTALHLSQLASDFIRDHRDHPFLLQVSFNAVHIPLSTTSRLRDKYQKKPAVAGFPCRPEYAGLLEELDTSVGTIVQAIEEVGLTDQTLVIFLSDNGGLVHEQDGDVVTSNSPLRGEKGTLYEGGIRIPSIWAWPTQIPAASLCEIPATTIDVFATLMEVAALTPPTRTDGVSLVRLWQAPRTGLDRHELFWHLPHYHHSTPASAIRSDDWKLIEFFEEGAVELYHLAADPSESQNLAAVQPTIAQQMRDSLAAWRMRVQAAIPMPNPDFDPARAQELGKSNERRSRKK
jgi:arylsulfatase A